MILRGYCDSESSAGVSPAQPDKPRPTEFSAKEGTGNTLIVLKHRKLKHLCPLRGKIKRKASGRMLLSCLRAISRQGRLRADRPTDAGIGMGAVRPSA